MRLLIYDDTCYLCGKFARAVRRLARGRIDVVGHYSEYGLSVKKKIFPADFDPSTMFWLVKEKQAFGGRSGLIAVAFEIVKGIFSSTSKSDTQNINMVCSNGELSCTSPTDFVKRVCTLMKNAKNIDIKN